MVLASLLQSIWVFALLQGGLQIPAPVGLVNDFAHVIPAEQARLIEQIAQDVRQKSRGEITVVTLPDIGQADVSAVALEIGRTWKVGKIGNPGDPTRNAGVVILIVPKETSSDGHGRCRIETGNGAEGFITDAQAGDICRSVTPLFQQRDYGDAIAQVTYAVAQRFAGEFNFSVDSTLRPVVPVQYQPQRKRGLPPQFIFLAIVMLILLLGGRRRGGGCLPLVLPIVGGGIDRGGWGSGGGGFGGGGGGGFGGFGGGGGFSGGGGGSSW